jgi:signal transduction histidine kinase
VGGIAINQLKNLVSFILLLTFSLFLSLSPANLKATEPDSILVLKSQVDEGTGQERMIVLRKLARFYSDTLSHVAMVYAEQYLNLAHENESLMDEATAYRILASIQKYQVDYRLGLNYNFKTLKALRKLGDSTEVAKEHFRIGDNYTFLYQFDSAILFIDSAYRYFKDKDQPFQNFRANLQLGKALCMDNHNREASDYFMKAINYANKLNDHDNIAWVEYWFGHCLMKMGDFDTATKYLLSSIENYNLAKNKSGKIGSEQALGELYLKTGDFANAYELFFSAYQELGYVKGDRGSKNYLSQYFLNMGAINFSIGNMEIALQYYDSAISIAKKMNLEGKIALANKHIGRVYFWMDNLDKAEAYYLESLSYYKKSKSDYTIADLLNKMGGVHEMNGNYRKAIITYKESLAINYEIENKFGIAQNHINLASCYKKTGDINAMDQEIHKGLQYAQLVNVDRLLLRYYKFLIEASEKTGQHNAAHAYFKKYIPLSEHTSEKTKINLSKMLVGLYTNELAREDKLHQKELELTKLEAQKSELQKKQWLIIAVSIGLVLIAIIVILVNRTRMTRILEKRVDERTRELKENEKKLIETNETKDRLYSIIAHDLKSPFNSLIGFSNLLHDEYDDFSEEERKQFIEIVRNNAEEIFALLENLLDWTRKSSQNMKFKPIRIDIQQVVKQTIQLQEKNAALKKITIENHIPKNTFVFADENMLRTIIRNLTSNAIKFTNEDGKIKFSVKRNNGFVECSVSDNGIGMSQKIIAQLFDLSKNAKKKGTANERGTGLGLLLCKDFAERNSGTLTVESRENIGSTFTLSLPEK